MEAIATSILNEKMRIGPNSTGIPFSDSWFHAFSSYFSALSDFIRDDEIVDEEDLRVTNLSLFICIFAGWKGHIATFQILYLLLKSKRKEENTGLKFFEDLADEV